ncbi:origin recognition complex subunit 4 [Actinomortierella ambigua]|uniref:Origin recognition complex subunit 4 n=1 Tax=Actinomortierella ambigua TaxID=1343610 RepID=A0A9P6PSG4_9FUNG|nr:origin recognition complex subunit 4 [Actinomortierella ambigua]
MASSQLINEAKRAIVSRLSEASLPHTLVGLEEQYKQVLNDLSKIFRAPSVDIGSNASLPGHDRDKDFMVIQLNGLVQTDDRMALKEIMRQLSREGESEITNTATTFSDSLPSLLTFLRTGTRDQHPIVFILDEFDLFAQHSKQSLLYNLFDVAQSAEWPVAVIGVTCRLDALDLLEKRVKSRFSHRHIYTFPPNHYHDYADICQNALFLYPSDFGQGRSENEGEMDMDVDRDDQGAGTEEEYYMNEFNRRVKLLFADGGFSKMVHRIFDLLKDVRGFYRLCFGPIAELNEAHPYLQPEQFYEAGLAQRVDPKTELLKGISLLELSLLIAIKHLVARDTITFNFEMVYDEYKDFMDMAVVRNVSSGMAAAGGSSVSSDGVAMRLYKKAVALKAFEHLVQSELLRPTDSSSKGPKEYRMVRVMLSASQIADVVLKHRDCPTLVARWAARK